MNVYTAKETPEF